MELNNKSASAGFPAVYLVLAACLDLNRDMIRFTSNAII